MPDLDVMENKTWQNAVNPMLTRLNADVSNHHKLAAPWHRKAQSMARSWLNILRSGRQASRRPRRAAPTTWMTATSALAVSLAQRAYQQQMRTGWRRWASDRSQEPSRWPDKFRTLRSPSSDAGAPAGALRPSRTAA